ncbi:MAG: Gfo/Idh/MocA family oxidoreductase [Candidatus Latescibacteria bacterium]|nr:Gfo/Idh/MocA family oxidoreductase [Candidatus Latescibacterota bacterium]
MKPLGVGIIGLRHLHPESYVPLFERIEETQLVAVAESDAGLLEAFERKTGAVGTEDWRALIARDDVDLVVIFLPHRACPEAAIAAAEAGKHVLVEKPMAATSEGVRRMAEAARGNGVKLSAPYAWRYHPVTKTIRKLIEDRILGDIVACEGRCAAGRPDRYLLGNSPWIVEKFQSGGGPMHNLGVHWIDLFRYLLKDEVARVSGEVVQSHPEMDIEDHAFALLRFEKGAVASLDISYSVPPAYPHGRDLYIEIRGTSGVLSWSPAWLGETDELLVCSDAEAYRDAPLRRMAIQSEKVPGYGGVMGLAFLRDFVRAIAEDRSPAVSPEDGIQALNVVEAIYRAAETRNVVDVKRDA